jgi:hypothetical protein
VLVASRLPWQIALRSRHADARTGYRHVAELITSPEMDADSRERNGDGVDPLFVIPVFLMAFSVRSRSFLSYINRDEAPPNRIPRCFNGGLRPFIARLHQSRILAFAKCGSACVV